MFCYHVHDRFGYRRRRSYEAEIGQEAGDDGILWREREWADMIWMIHTVSSAGSPNPRRPESVISACDGERSFDHFGHLRSVGKSAEAEDDLAPKYF